MDARDILKDLLNEIAAIERDLGEKRRVATFLQAKIAGDLPPFAQALHGVTKPVSELEAELAALREGLQAGERARLAAEDERRRRLPVMGHVRNVILEFGNTEFGVAEVAAAMEKKRMLLSRTHISTILARLVERGFIYLSNEGGGSRPNLYSKVAAGTAVSPSNAASALERASDPDEFA
jgi:hypothetical protein